MPPRLPLGEFYDGECRAASEPNPPPFEVVTKFCNNGYGRGDCERFPNDASADAVRFTILDVKLEPLRVHFVLEKNYWPARDGNLEYSRTAGEFLKVDVEPVLLRQAEAFVAAFLSRTDIPVCLPTTAPA